MLRHVDQTSNLAGDPEKTGVQSPAASRVGPFILGTVIGGLAGAVVGTALSPHTRGFVVGLYHLVNRRLSSSEHDQLRFELLLQ
ncbi:MAG TPA: hypothetical protein VK356_11230 [Thermomicrobiales bacterium]|nr:hypothetical protein [Thermomicrobiales bacterium]